MDLQVFPIPIPSPINYMFLKEVWASQVALVVKNLPANAGVSGAVNEILGWENPLEEEMAINSSILAWTGETGRLHTIHRVTKSQT